MKQIFNLSIEVQEASNDDPTKGYMVESDHLLHVSIVGRKEKSTDQFNFSFFIDNKSYFSDIYITAVKKFEKMVTGCIDRDSIRTEEAKNPMFMKPVHRHTEAGKEEACDNRRYTAKSAENAINSEARKAKAEKIYETAKPK